MNVIESLLAELRHESATTRAMLARIPERSLAWKPHEKSRTVGEIAAHIANLPGLFLVPLHAEKFDRNSYSSSTNTVSEILATFDKNMTAALEQVAKLSNEQLLAPWQYTYGERTIFAMPRLAVIRAMAINHIIHHRGQLSVYLRLLDVPLPPVYGPTADES